MAKGRPTVDHAYLQRATSSDVDNSVGQNGTPSRVRREAATPGRFEDLSLLFVCTFACVLHLGVT